MDHYPRYAIYAFGQLGYEEYASPMEAFARRWGGLELDAFIRALQEGKEKDKVLAIWALGYEPAVWAREYLLPFLQNTEPMERWASALGLGKMGEPVALPVLLRMLTEFFPPKESPASQANGLWLYNGWRVQVIRLLREWTQPEVVPALLAALQAYWRLEQAIPEESQIARRYWRQCQEAVMHTLGWLGRFDLLPGMVRALDIVQPTLSSWRVYLVLGSLHVASPDLFAWSIFKESDVREQVMAALQERFDLSPKEQAHCLTYFRVQQRW
jgi:hypothetical protein